MMMTVTADVDSDRLCHILVLSLSGYVFSAWNHHLGLGSTEESFPDILMNIRGAVFRDILGPYVDLALHKSVVLLHMSRLLPATSCSLPDL
jgi:hypothetical protein